MAGVDDSQAAQTVQESALFDEVEAYVEECVCEYYPGGHDVLPDEAARALLRGRVDYDMTCMTVVPLVESELSLPESVHNAPYADAIADDRARTLIEGLHECATEVGGCRGAMEDLPTPYMDRG